MKSFFVKEDFLSDAECAACINYYEAFKDDTFQYKWNDSRPLKLVGHEEHFVDITHRVANLIATLDPTGKMWISNHEIVKWSPGSKMAPHYDLSYDKWSAILYLNDDFFGGRTFFSNGIELKPKMGSIVIFNGTYFKHGVTEVLNGERYTMAYWVRYNESTDDAE